MSASSDAVARLLALGEPGSHPAGAIAGVRTAAGTSVRVGGWAVLPGAVWPGVPMMPELLLDLASVTKVAATTVLVMRLVAAGELRLDDEVRAVLPGFRGDGRDGITLRHLLTHTAGLRPWWPLYLETTDRAEAIEFVQCLPLASAAGTAWRYSDLGLILAGAVVERVAGLGLADAYRGLVAEPLGLTSRYGPVPPEAAATSADSDAVEYRMVGAGAPYPVPFVPEAFDGWRDRLLRGEADDGNVAHALGGVSGHAGLFSTVDDLLVLGAALRSGELVPTEVLEAFAQPTPVHPEQAVGFRRVALRAGGEELTVLRHGGFTGTSFGFALERELVLAGGATRLHGTVGHLPSGDAPAAAPELVAVDTIQDVLLAAGAEALAAGLPDPQTAPTPTPGEER